MVMVASQIVESNTHAEKMDLGKKKPLRFDNVMIASSQLQESKCGKNVFFDYCCAHHNDCGSPCTLRLGAIGRLKGPVTIGHLERQHQAKQPAKQAKNQNSNPKHSRFHDRRKTEERIEAVTPWAC